MDSFVSMKINIANLYTSATRQVTAVNNFVTAVNSLGAAGLASTLDVPAKFRAICSPQHDPTAQCAWISAASSTDLRAGCHDSDEHATMNSDSHSRSGSASGGSSLGWDRPEPTVP